VARKLPWVLAAGALVAAVVSSADVNAQDDNIQTGYETAVLTEISPDGSATTSNLTCDWISAG
jgi:hypothetical protein